MCLKYIITYLDLVKNLQYNTEISMHWKSSQIGKNRRLI
jgi:hypothetical protein